MTSHSQHFHSVTDTAPSSQAHKSSLSQLMGGGGGDPYHCPLAGAGPWLTYCTPAVHCFVQTDVWVCALFTLWLSSSDTVMTSGVMWDEWTDQVKVKWSVEMSTDKDNTVVDMAKVEKGKLFDFTCKWLLESCNIFL